MKLLPLYRQKKEIEDWLDSRGVIDYQLIKNKEYGYVVNVNRDVSISMTKIEQLMVKFNVVDGNFFINHTGTLKTLLGCPESVKNFSARGNKLKSLKYGPKWVSGNYSVDYNQITSLIGAPEKVRNFVASENKLKNLEGTPKIIEGYFLADRNLITSLLFFPDKIDGDIFLSNNPFGPNEQLNEWDTLYAMHIIEKKAFEEKKMLENQLGLGSANANNAKAGENLKNRDNHKI